MLVLRCDPPIATFYEPCMSIWPSEGGGNAARMRQPVRTPSRNLEPFRAAMRLARGRHGALPLPKGPPRGRGLG
jgi:hypothetical protein